MLKTKDRQSHGGGNLAVGEALRAAREARGLSYQQVSEECKLQERFIKAIEAGHTDYLPAHIYFRMFARMYAETLSIDPDQLLGRMYPEAPEPEFGTGISDVSVTVDNPDDPDELLAAAVSGQQTTSIAPTAPSRPIERPPQVITPQYVPDRRAPGGSSAGLTLANALAAYSRTLKIGAAVTLGVATVFVLVKFGVFNDSHADEGSQPAKDTLTTSATSTAAALEELGLSGYSAAEELELTIRAREATGVVIVADGDTLFARKLEAGEALTWKSEYRFRIDIAEKDNVELFVAGQRLKPLQGNDKHVTDFEINQLNYQELLLNAPAGD